jgi:hypothetical protein
MERAVATPSWSAPCSTELSIAYRIGDHESAQASDQSALAGTISNAEAHVALMAAICSDGRLRTKLQPDYSTARDFINPPRADTLIFQCTEGLSDPPSSAKITRSVDASHRGGARSTRLQSPR